MSTDTQTWLEVTDDTISTGWSQTGMDSSTSRQGMCTQTWPGNTVGKSHKHLPMC